MKIVRFITTISFILAFSISTFAQNTLESIIKTGELRVGMTGDQPPFSMKLTTGDLIGFDVDLANALAYSMNVKLVIVEMPFAELLPSLEKGSIDMILSGMTITPERNLKALFAGPYTISGKSILTKSAVLAQADDAGDVNNKQYKIVALKGSTSESFVKMVMPDAELILVDRYEEAVDRVLNNQADVMVADYPVCIINAIKYESQGLVTLDQPLTNEPIGIAVPAGDIQFHNLVDNYLNSLILTDGLELLHEIWFQNGTWLSDVK